MSRRTNPRSMHTVVALGLPLVAAPAAAQTVLDRVDPTRVEATARREARPPADAPPVATTAPAATASPAAGPVTVGAVALHGLQVLHPADFADIFEIYVGRTLSPPALAGLADEIAARMHRRGYVLATARIPAQPLTAGILRIEVDEGAIDAVRVLGASNRAVEAALVTLVGKGPVRLVQLERRLLIAGDVDGVWLRRTRLVREGGRNVLEVEVGADRVSAEIGLDNSGSRPIGPLQADLTASVSQLFAAEDVASVTAVVTPTQPDELGYLRARYARRVSRDGLEVSASASYARTHPGAYLLSRDIDGQSWTARVDLLRPLIRQRDASLWLTGSLGLRTVRQERADVLARRDRLTVARVGTSGFSALAGGRLRASVLLGQGLDWFGATRARDPLASRGDADGVFTTLNLAASWTTPVAHGIGARIAVATQLAARPLLVSEEVGLGGGDFLRGYDYSERSGDRGSMGSAELRWTPVAKAGPATRPTLYAFVDGGKVTNLRGGFGSGTLFSAGGGLRTDLARHYTIDIGAAVPLSGPRYDSGNARPVLNFRISRRF